MLVIKYICMVTQKVHPAFKCVKANIINQVKKLILNKNCLENITLNNPQSYCKESHVDTCAWLFCRNI